MLSVICCHQYNVHTTTFMYNMARYLSKKCFNHALFMKQVALLVCWHVCLFVLYPRCLFFSLVWLLQRWWGFRTAVPVLSKRLVLLEYGGGLDVWTHSTVGCVSAEKGRRRGGWKYVSVLQSQMSNATICLCLWVFACTSRIWTVRCTNTHINTLLEK